ncbi:MAG: HEAT repeat domain-containing protein [Planctomycetes bacterium]|nr:HEAT repeat domain-containing protein [Planctomycetota bacterium]
MRVALALLAFLLALPAAADEIADLVKALGDDDYDAREKAAGRLAEIGVPALPALREALNSTDPEVRAKAGRAIDLIEWRGALPKSLVEKYPTAAEDIIEADDDGRVKWVQLLATASPGIDAVPAALRFLPNGTARIRKDALLLVSRRSATLSALRDANSLDRLVPFLRDDDTGLRVLALSVAGEWGRPTGTSDALAATIRLRVVPEAIGALDATDGTVRAAAARALGRIADPAAVPRLCSTAGDSVSAVRVAAIEALGAIGDPRGAVAASRALMDEGTDVVRAGIEACARMKARETIPAIRAAAAVSGRAPILRQAALEALETIDPPAVDDARQFLGDTNPTLRATAWRIILAVDASEAPKAAADEDAEVRLIAAVALARTARAAAVPALVALLDDDRSATVRDARGRDVARGEIRAVAMESLATVTGRKSAGGDVEAAVEDWKKWAAGGGK